MPLSRIKSASITDGSVATADLANGAVSNTKLATGSVENYFGTQGFALGMRNRIINGDMRIDQRNAGVSVTPTDGAYTLDRWRSGVSAASKLTVQQNAGSATPPAGFTNYLGVTSSSAYSITSGDYFTLGHIIEGFNAADLNWGTANAQSVTLSFWVRSSLTGTFGGSLRNGSINRSYPFAYTINAANTFEYKTITISGDTSGTWLTNNGSGIIVTFGLGVGSTFSGTAGAWAGSNFNSATGAVSVVGTSGATFYITGVQLEAGSVATPFERRPYGTELALCQRYYIRNSISPGYLFGRQNGGNAGEQKTGVNDSFPTEMRASPTVTYTFTNNDAAQDGGLASASPRGVRFRGQSGFSGEYFLATWAYQATAEL